MHHRAPRSLLSLLAAVAAFATSGCRASAPPPLAPRYRVTSAVTGDSVSAAARAHDPIAAALGLPPLRLAHLPAGVREFRLSTGHGMVAGWEYPLVRLVAEEGRPPRGEVWLYRQPRDTTEARTAGGLVTRRGRLQPAPEWVAIGRRLDSLRTEVFRSRGAGRRMVFDAGELYVEYRAGAEYRAQWINAPAWRARFDPAAEAPAAVAALIDSLGRVAGAP
ncbi:hypothetical protein [Roseisolibacter sp. H3M3-2]|uniref:hypothetical protein n=1 Tax=Roseisolibacter sp. H3M3-2 TaxID=3031323 RepID=UPI0023DB2AB6|nr:hypothetical protein [Roseisolibacter sp. H3M3-2]MDF1501820.1 hypothetical protein [Roseisolibacter sp. H3M3-2]